jgi:cellulose synthase operon protein C
MNSGQPTDPGSVMPWSDRGDRGRETRPDSPRSRRDLELLRALARRINPQDASAHNNLGVVYYNKGLYAEAVRHFELALELDPRMQVAERNLQICYFGTGHLASQTMELRRRLEANPSDSSARDQLARLHYNSGDLPSAVRELRALLTARPNDASVHLRLARTELKRGDLDAALDSLRRAESLDGRNARVHFMIGEVLYQRGKSGEAREALERAVGLDDSLAEAFHLLAFVYGDLNETARAQRSSARAAQLNPSYGKAEAGLSLDSYSTARYQELIGIEASTQQPVIHEGGELAHYNLGLAFRQRALYDEALREFRLATERGEDSFLVQQAQAEMMLMRGESAEALQLYRALIEHERSSPKLWNELGVARHQTGALQEAEQAYRRALEIDPAYALAWNNLAVVRHHRSGADAEEAMRSALREGRALADLWRNLALLLQQSGRGDEALEAYEQALEVDPSSAQACTGMGVLLLEMGRAHEARGVLFRAVELDPQLAEARYHLGFAYSALGDYQSALRETKIALELNPYIPTPRFRLLIDLQFEEASLPAPDLDSAARIGTDDGVESFHFEPTSLERVFDETPGSRVEQASPAAELLEAARQSLERGLLENASSQAQRASMYGADRTEVLLLQGEIFLRRELSGEAVERFSEALAEIRRSGTGDQDDSLRRALHGAARSLLDLGRMGEAIEAAERLCELAPGDVEALRTLGEALSRVHDYARAAIVLEQARLAAPNDVNLLTRLGEAYAAAGDPDGAEAALRRAVSLDSWAVGARTALADVLAENGLDGEAESEYGAALKTLPTYGAAAFGLAALHERNDRQQQAVGCMVDLLTHDPARLDALNRLGDLLTATGREAEARFAYERVLRFDPGDEAAREALDRLSAVQV